MEIIYGVLTEKRTIQIAWKQMVTAALLALLLAGLCRVILVQNNRSKEEQKEYAVPIADAMAFRESERNNMLSEEFLKDYDGRIDPELAVADSGPAVREKGYVTRTAAGKYGVAGEEKERTPAGTHSNMAIDSTEEKAYTENITVTVPEGTVTDSTIGSDFGAVGNIGESIKDDVEKDEGKTAAPAVVLTVELYGNGGTPEKITDSCNVEEFSIAEYETPTRPGKLFDGWFYDKEGKEPFSKAKPGQENLILYAGWKEFPGLLCNDKGYLTGYTDASKLLEDSLLILPKYDTCTGIEKDALKGLEEEIREIYIPENISYIESGAFDDLTNLFYIEVHPKNSSFYSSDGILYEKNGQIAAFPSRMRDQ